VGAGEIEFAPMYNTSYRRPVLIEFGEQLERALRGGDRMAIGLRARNRRVYFEPAARIDHRNFSVVADWAYERYLGGLLISADRSRRWSWSRRLLYFLGSPLLPALYLARVWTGIRTERRSARLPFGTFPMVIAGALVKATGETVGYLRGAREEDEALMTHFELHRAVYAGRAP
jgi:hypothetical protein